MIPSLAAVLGHDDARPKHGSRRSSMNTSERRMRRMTHSSERPVTGTTWSLRRLRPHQSMTTGQIQKGPGASRCIQDQVQHGTLSGECAELRRHQRRGPDVGQRVPCPCRSSPLTRLGADPKKPNPGPPKGRGKTGPFVPKTRIVLGEGP